MVIYLIRRSEKKVSLGADSNTILFRLSDGHDFKICVNFFNNKYLSLAIEIEGNEDFEARINNIDAFGKEGIIRTVADIITYAENVR